MAADGYCVDLRKSGDSGSDLAVVRSNAFGEAGVGLPGRPQGLTTICVNLRKSAAKYSSPPRSRVSELVVTFRKVVYTDGHGWP